MVDLLKGLDLAHFGALPEVLEIDYKGSVDFKVWAARSAFNSESNPDLYVDNLDLITGKGDERVIVGVTELLKMFQSYKDKMDYNKIVAEEDGATIVQYFMKDNAILTVDFGTLLKKPSGIFKENVAAADVVAAFGSPTVWKDGPAFKEVQFTLEGGNLIVDYGDSGSPFTSKLKASYEEALIFSSLPPDMFRATLEAGGGHYWWSEPAFKEVQFTLEGGNLIVDYGDSGSPFTSKLKASYEEALIFSSLPPDMFRATLEAGGGHYWWSEPAFKEVQFTLEGGNLIVDYEDSGSPFTPRLKASFEWALIDQLRTEMFIATFQWLGSRERFETTMYFFRWDLVPGDENERLIRVLRDDFAIDWAENAEISKLDKDTIRIFKDGNKAEIHLDKNKKIKATLKISDGRTHILKVKREKGKLNIYVTIIALDEVKIPAFTEQSFI